MSMKFFERPLLPNYVYPCSLDEIQQALTQLPEQDLAGLEAIGLVPATRKDGSAYARYFVKPKSAIYIYSITATLLFKQPSTVKLSDIEIGLADALEYGLQVQTSGSRWICQWRREDLNRFILGHVLPHEVGHHVFHQQRLKEGTEKQASFQVREQFAEHYALRHKLK